MKKSILITGTSTGIGRACVEYFLKKDFQIFAGIRNESDLEDLDVENQDHIFPIILDINNEYHIESVYQVISATVKENGLQGLINNAAIGIAGPLEYASSECILKQFSTNVFGPIRLIQKMLPLLKMGRGRIINVGSTNGFISFPYMAVYSSTKFALEAISDALRIELKPFNIPVILINPDKISTPIWQKSMKLSERYFSELPDEARKMYEVNFRKFLKAVVNISNESSSPMIVVKMIEHALSHPNPKARYLPGLDAKTTLLISKLLPKKILDKLIMKNLGF